jgi:hypothetical protein
MLFAAIKLFTLAARGCLLGVFIGEHAVFRRVPCFPISAAGCLGAMGSKPPCSAACAGLAAQTKVATATTLLGVLLGAQASFTLLVLVLRPYISRLLNIIVVLSSCLDITNLALTMVAYGITQGSIADDGRVTVSRRGLHCAASFCGSSSTTDSSGWCHQPTRLVHTAACVTAGAAAGPRVFLHCCG